MRSEPEAGRLRRYVLGASSDDERDAIEREYFDHSDALDGVREAEDDLIDDYLSDRLGRDERQRFERYYLSTPYHRRRVAVVHGLRNAAAAARSIDRRGLAASWWPMAGLAAALVILVAGGIWITGSRPGSTMVPVGSRGQPAAPPASARAGSDRRGPAEQEPRPATPAAPRATPVVVAVSISPILVRGADEPPVVTINPEVEIVRLQLQGGPGEGPLGRGRAVVRTVAGREVWRGPAVQGSRPHRGLARVDIPAARLRPDDYIIELIGAGAGGREVERYQYFLRVRAP